MKPIKKDFLLSFIKVEVEVQKHITFLFGCPYLAPIAAGNPYPMVPRPPDDKNVLGFV